MANWQVISLDTTTPQLRAPGTGDGYSFNSGSTQLGVWTTTGLGIGTASPVFKLVVSNAGAQGFEFDPSVGLMQVYNRSTSSYGEFRPYASLMRFFTGSSPTETMRLDSTGLGIGTTSPSQKLSVNGGLNVLGAATVPAAQGSMLFSYESAVNRCYMGDGTGYSFAFSKRVSSTTTDLVTILDSGNVGIGTTSPGALLDVYSATTSNYVRVGSASTFSAGLSIAANANTHLTSGSLVYQDSSNRLNLLNYANAALRLGTNNTFRVSVPAAGGMVVGTAALATNATDGFLYVPTCAGAPTGTPTAQTGTAPIVIDTTNNKLYFYSGGAWRDAGP